jgi:protein-S-isoprenylcysteine O-methyltransferase Ste14
VTVRYSSAFKPTVLLVLIAWMVALGYWRRVGIYLLLLLVATFYAGIIALIDPGPVINSHAFYLNIVFSTGMTNFIFIGIPFEELDLVKAYGERYERHRHQPWGRESAF